MEEEAKAAELSIVSDSVCQRLYGNVGLDTKLCAGGYNLQNVGICSVSLLFVI